MTPFVRARQAANELRQRLFSSRARDALPSNELVAAATEAEDLLVDPINPEDLSLGRADALLVRELRQILVRNDVSGAEQAFLVSHEIGHWLLHPDEHEGCHKIVETSLSPDKGETFGAHKVEAYGARERAELQANVFAKEFLLPRSTARALFLDGKSAMAIATNLSFPLELVRQQLLDGLLLPSEVTEEETPEDPIKPTKQQQDAAASDARVSLIVAGPGTGKTTTLLLRVQYLLTHGVSASEILVLTFSNRAARELADRLKRTGIPNSHEIWVGTFHAFGLEFLRKNHEHFGLEPNIGVADKLAQIALIEPHIHDVGLKAFNPLGDPLDWLAEVVKTIQRAKDELVGPAEFQAAVQSEETSTDQELQARREDVAALYARYETEKKRGGRLADLGDLVMLPVLALQSDLTKFHASVGRFKHILVDEYQDVNRASAELIKAMAQEAASLWVVGDPRQAIYRFRGASMRNIVRFGKDFPGYIEFELSENRRSFEEVVRLFEHTGRENHPLQLDLPLGDVAAVRGTGGARPQRVICPDAATVNAELVSSAQALTADGVAYRNQVVLASTHKTCGAAAEALNQASIPALYLGDIFQREEIKNLLTVLHALVDRSGSGFVRLGKLSGNKLSEADLRILLPWLRINRPKPLSWLSKSPEGLSSDGARAIKYWRKAFSGLKSSDSPWDVVCEILLDRTDLLKPYLDGDDIISVTKRLALWQFIYFLRVPDGVQPYQTVGSFVSRLRRRLRVGDDNELRIPPPEADSLDAVSIMTIHGSKGLEFEAVHLVDVDAFHFGRGDKASSLLPNSLLESISDEDEFEAATEGANKLYVALSRAKRHLILYENAGRWNAKSVPSIVTAAHLYETRNGASPNIEGMGLSKSPQSTSGVIESVELTQFVSYLGCPQRYFYEHVLELSPSSGLPPSVLVESAVMEEIFAAQGALAEELANSPGVLDRVLDDFAETEPQALPYLKAYAEMLMKNGRALLGRPRVTLPETVNLNCNGLTVTLAPHQMLRNGRVRTLRFFRARPVSDSSRQAKALRWMVRALGDLHRDLSFEIQVAILSTGQIVSISPYNWRIPDFLTEGAENIRAGTFTPNLGSRNCPRCRHFPYCPA